MTVLMRLSGFLYLFIFILQIAMASFGYILEPTQKHYESEDTLLKINDSPKKFKISIVLAIIEHFCVITLPILLYIVFSHYNVILGVIWMVFRIAEGSIQVYIEKDYWKLLKLARQHSASSDTEKNAVMDSYRMILKTKSIRFAFAMISWAIGTLTFSIVLVAFGIGPIFIGWIGIAASIIIGISNVINLVKPNLKIYEILSSIGGLVSILFEVLIGVWFLFILQIIP